MNLKNPIKNNKSKFSYFYINKQLKYLNSEKISGLSLNKNPERKLKLVEDDGIRHWNPKIENKNNWTSVWIFYLYIYKK